MKRGLGSQSEMNPNWVDEGETLRVPFVGHTNEVLNWARVVLAAVRMWC